MPMAQSDSAICTLSRCRLAAYHAGLRHSLQDRASHGKHRLACSRWDQFTKLSPAVPKPDELERCRSRPGPRGAHQWRHLLLIQIVDLRHTAPKSQQRGDDCSRARAEDEVEPLA